MQDYYSYGMVEHLRSFSYENYKFGFNGQEKVDEVSGNGNHNTAMFWEYDTRAGRRWNIDLDLNASFSPYACLSGNPIFYIDLLGDSPTIWQGFKGYLSNSLQTIPDNSSAAQEYPLLTWLHNSLVTAEMQLFGNDIQTLSDPNASLNDKVNAAISLSLTVTAVGGEGEGEPVVKETPVDYSNIKDPKTVGPGKKFTASQKAKILEANKKANGGVLKSDQSGTPLNPPQKSMKGQKADMNQAEVDHITAKSKGGSNSYSNAALLSKKENLVKGTKSKGLRDGLE